MKVLVCGSRDWWDRARIDKRLDELPISAMIIQGGARGADNCAALYATDHGMPLVIVPANWEKFGKRAGFLRNNWMLDLAPDLVIAFHKNNSPGTQSTITEARRRGIPVEIIIEREAIAR